LIEREWVIGKEKNSYEDILTMKNKIIELENYIASIREMLNLKDK
jgi:hypothetical protein